MEKLLRGRRIESQEMIQDLFFFSVSQYDLKRRITIKETSKSREPFYYRTGSVYINWEVALQLLSSKDAFSFNCYLYFILLHEVAHAYQEEESNQNLVINNLYKSCFDYVSNSSDDNHLSSLLKELNYRHVHDYFPFEINADMESYERILPLLQNIDKKKYREYYKKWLNRSLEIWNGYTKIDTVIKELLALDISYSNYSLEECMHYGLPFKALGKKEILCGIEKCKMFSIKH